MHATAEARSTLARGKPKEKTFPAPIAFGNSAATCSATAARVRSCSASTGCRTAATDTGGSYTRCWEWGSASVTEMGGLVGEDGVALKNLFSGPVPPEPTPPAATPAAQSAGALPAHAVSSEVLAGPHGEVLRQARSDHRRISDVVGRLSETERKMLPDVKGTADALYERIIALARGAASPRRRGRDRSRRGTRRAHRADRAAGATGDAGDRERRLGLLRRQREMLAELDRSRASLHEQYESAGLLLQNLVARHAQGAVVRTRLGDRRHHERDAGGARAVERDRLCVERGGRAEGTRQVVVLVGRVVIRR